MRDGRPYVDDAVSEGASSTVMLVGGFCLCGCDIQIAREPGEGSLVPLLTWKGRRNCALYPFGTDVWSSAISSSGAQTGMF